MIERGHWLDASLQQGVDQFVVVQYAVLVGHQLDTMGLYSTPRDGESIKLNLEQMNRNYRIVQ